MSCLSILFLAIILFLSFHARKGYSFSTRDDESVNSPGITHNYPRMKVTSLTRHGIWTPHSKPKENKRKLTVAAQMVDKFVTKTKTRGRYSRYWVKNAKDFKGEEPTTVMDYAQPHEEPSVHN